MDEPKDLHEFRSQAEELSLLMGVADEMDKRAESGILKEALRDEWTDLRYALEGRAGVLAARLRKFLEERT